jgi:hypothetical protein
MKDKSLVKRYKELNAFTEHERETDLSHSWSRQDML